MRGEAQRAHEAEQARDGGDARGGPAGRSAGEGGAAEHGREERRHAVGRPGERLPARARGFSAGLAGGNRVWGNGTWASMKGVLPEKGCHTE